jgi:hypothetical protein
LFLRHLFAIAQLSPSSMEQKRSGTTIEHKNMKKVLIPSAIAHQST